MLISNDDGTVDRSEFLNSNTGFYQYQHRKGPKIWARKITIRGNKTN